MQAKDISVAVILATRPDTYTERGLITFMVDVPLYIWTELLTHRRFSRNASSARAMSTKRYSDMGFYLPDTWYTQGEGMKSGEQMATGSLTCIEAYQDVMEYTSILAQEFTSQYNVAKEQANRIIPPLKMVRGIVTGTEDAWQWFLKLRNHPSADVAMQRFAQKVHALMYHIAKDGWNYSSTHTPFEADTIEQTIARIARVSYNRERGKNDVELYQYLIEQNHLSPFEHVAQWVTNPHMSNFTSKQEDVQMSTLVDNVQWWKNTYSGWQSLRSELERNNE